MPKLQRARGTSLAPLADGDFMLDGGTAMALRLGHRGSIGFDSFSERTLHEAPLRKRLALLDHARLEQTEAKTCVGRIAIGGEKFGWPFRLRSAGNTKAKRRSGRLSGFSLDLPTTALKLMLERAEAKHERDTVALFARDGRLPMGLPPAPSSGATSRRRNASALTFCANGDWPFVDAGVGTVRMVDECPQFRAHPYAAAK